MNTDKGKQVKKLSTLRSARYKMLKDGTSFGEIRGWRRVWANAKNLQDCQRELRQVLEEWILLKPSL